MWQSYLYDGKPIPRKTVFVLIQDTNPWPKSINSSHFLWTNGLLTSYAKSRVAHTPGMPGIFPRHQLPDALAVMHVVSLTRSGGGGGGGVGGWGLGVGWGGGWGGRCSWHSRCMRNQFNLSWKRPVEGYMYNSTVWVFFSQTPIQNVFVVASLCVCF